MSFIGTLFIGFVAYDHLGFLDIKYVIHPFVPNEPFLYPLKISMFSGAREKVHWEQKG